MKTRIEIYKELRDWYYNTFKSTNHILDQYKGQNRAMRLANIYAVKNTNKAFYNQMKDEK